MHAGIESWGRIGHHSGVIDTPEALEALCERLAEAGCFALDTEFIRDDTFHPILCLVQVAGPDELALIDPLALPDLGPLLHLLRDPGVEVVVHAGQQDMEILAPLVGGPPVDVFDTQVAAALAGLGEAMSYGRLVKQLCAVDLKKGQARTDWARRPLREAQLDYALNDVRYLLEMADALEEMLDERGRSQWLVEELGAYEDPENYAPRPRERFRRIKGVGKFKGRSLAVLQELAAWREAEASRKDRPRGWILEDRALLAIVERKPRRVGDLQKVSGLSPRLVQRAGEAIMAAIQRGLDRPESDHPELSKEPQPTTQQVLLAEVLRLVLEVRAKAENISASALGNKRDIAAVARWATDGGPRPKLLRGWRGELVGQDLEAALAGERWVGIEEGYLRIKSS